MPNKMKSTTVIRHGLVCRVLSAEDTRKLLAEDRAVYLQRQLQNINNRASKYNY